MKHLTIKVLVVIIMAGMGFSCSKRIDDAYANPNADVRVAPEQLLPEIVSAMAGNYGGHGTMNDIRYIGAYVQNWQFYLPLSNFDRMGYTNTVGDVAQSTWRMHYYDIGQNNKKMIEWATEDKKWDYVGVGQAIFAWSWLTLTDYYGDVILKEAFNTSQLTFHYDTQEDVYEYVKQLCFQSLENLNKAGDNTNTANLAKGDAYLYKGDVNKWKKFVYGVLARYYNHLSNKATYKPDSVLYYTSLSITSNADNALVNFQASQITATNNLLGPLRANLTGAAIISPTAIRQGAYIANLESGVNPAFPGVTDPRAWYILRANANNTFKGLERNIVQSVLSQIDRPENFWGVPQITANNTAPAKDTASRFIFTNNAPFPIMTATEILFMKAEAAFRKGDKAAALAAYKEAISLHFDMLTTTYNVNIPAGREITPATKAAYLADPAIMPAAPAGLTLSKIMLQKYIAMFGYGILETWVDMRRMHYTDPDPESMASGPARQVYADFIPPSGTDLFPDNAGNLVYRMRPRFNSEYVWNVVELQRIGADKNDYHTKKMWFSEK